MAMFKEKKRVISITALILLTGSFIQCSLPSEDSIDDKRFKVDTPKEESEYGYKNFDKLLKKIESDSEKSIAKKLLWVKNATSSFILLSYTAVTTRKGDKSRLSQNLKPGEWYCIGEIDFISTIFYQESTEESDGCCFLPSCCFEPKEYTIDLSNKIPNSSILVQLEDDCCFRLRDEICYLEEDKLPRKPLSTDPSQRLLTRSSYKGK